MQIPIENIYYILCYAWNKLEEKNIVNVTVSDHTEILNLFARILIVGMNRLLRRGIDRDYLRYGDDTQSLRGKINFQESIKRNLFVYAKAHCEYDEMDHDVIHNQILKATIRKLIYLKYLDKTYRDELIFLLRRFHHISDIDVSDAHFSRVRLHRNNLFYDFLLKICRLVLDNILVNEETGESKFMDFIRDEKKMALVFEAFLKRFYKLEQSDFSVISEKIRWDAEPVDEESAESLPIMETDISLESDNRKIIIDAKYYKKALVEGRFGKEIIHSGHLYQLAAYLKNMEVRGGVNSKCEGILIYPAVEKELNLGYKKLLGHRVSVRTINLNQSWKKIEKDLLSFLK